jgi:mono/diheme cytochrome c family protein
MGIGTGLQQSALDVHSNPVTELPFFVEMIARNKMTREMFMKPKAFLLIAALAGSISSTGWTQDSDAGKLEYLSSCSACHGADGKGGGPLAAELKTRPADLTTLAKRNGGVFPLNAIYQTVDGRKPIGSHGTKEMPIWGSRFAPSPFSSPQTFTPKPTDSPILMTYDPEIIVRLRILAVIDYLNRIQEK